MMGELSGTLSAQTALTPHLYQLWESPQDGFFKFNLILNATWRFSKYPYFLALKIQSDWFLSQVLKSS